MPGIVRLWNVSRDTHEQSRRYEIRHFLIKLEATTAKTLRKKKSGPRKKN